LTFQLMCRSATRDVEPTGTPCAACGDGCYLTESALVVHVLSECGVAIGEFDSGYRLCGSCRDILDADNT